MIATREPTAPRKQNSMNDFQQPSPVAEREPGPQPHEMNEYEVTSAGSRVGERPTGSHGLITGVPEPLGPQVRSGDDTPGTPDRKE